MMLFSRALGFVAMLLAAAMCVACVSGYAPAGPDAGGSAEIQEYRLGPGDRLKINVFGEEAVSGEFVVSPGGAITYPLLGEVPAQGRTVAEFTLQLTEALQRYVRRPNIGVEVMNYRPYYILGEVKNPSTYPYQAGLTVFNAVAIAGGFTYRADTRRVFIKHADEAEAREYRLTMETRIQPGDTVRIAERLF